MPPKLLVDGELCDPIPSEAQYEDDFESSLVAYSRSIFTGWHVCKFKCPVSAPGTQTGTSRADLALVNPSATCWWVVEVELAHHSLDRHILPQVEVLSLGSYGPSHVLTLHQFLSESLSVEALSRMVATRQPNILVVVNDYRKGWKAILSDYAQLLVVKPFRDRHGQYRFVIEGDIPYESSGRESICIREDAMPRSLSVRSPLPLGLVDGAELAIHTESGITHWKFMRLGSNAFLFAIGRYPLSGRNKFFLLSRNTDNNFHLKPISQSRGRSML